MNKQYRELVKKEYGSSENTRETRQELISCVRRAAIVCPLKTATVSCVLLP